MLKLMMMMRVIMMMVIMVATMAMIMMMMMMTMLMVLMPFDDYEHDVVDHDDGRIFSIDQVPMDLGNDSKRSYGTGSYSSLL